METHMIGKENEAKNDTMQWHEGTESTKPNLKLNPSWTFGKFVVGSSNMMAFNAAKAVSSKPGALYNPLYIYGASGLGKTHLMHAIGHHFSTTMPGRIDVIDSEVFTNDYIWALQNRELPIFRRYHRSAEVLIIDDVHFFAGKERMQEELRHTFDALHSARKQIVVFANQPPSHIAGLNTELANRFESGLCVNIQQPDLKLRSAILKNKLADMKITLSAEFVTYIATSIPVNPRRLEGALIRATSYQSLAGEKLTLPTLKKILEDLTEQGAPKEGEIGMARA
jgi:chromosomal replication initiator protein